MAAYGPGSEGDITMPGGTSDDFTVQDSEAGPVRHTPHSHEEWRDFFQGIPQPVVILDPAHGVVATNRAALKELGKTEEEVLGKKCHDLFHGTGHVTPGCPMERLLSEGWTGTLEMEMETLHGTFLVSCTPILDDKGNITRVVHVATDVTKLKDTQKTLLQARFMMDHASESIHGLGPDGSLTYVNESMCAGLGYSRDELLAMKVFDLDPGVFPDTFRSYWGKLRTKGSLTLETIHRRKDGSTFPVEIKATHYLHEGEEYVVAFGRDITERRLAEQRVLDSERSLFAILSASPIGIGKIKDRIFGWVNETMRSITGYAPEELTGKSSRLLYESDEEYERAGKALYGKEGRAEAKLRGKDGVARDVIMQASPTDSYSFIFTVSDITKQKEAEDALRFTQFAVDKARDTITWLGEEGDILYVNDAASAATGFSREELLSMKLFDLDPDISPEIWGRRWIARKAFGSASLESRHRRKDGSTCPIEVSSSYLEYNGKGYVCAITRDITERRKTEEQLRESEERNRVAIEHSNDAVSMVKDGKHIFVNGRFVEIFGYDNTDEIMGRRIEDFVHPDDSRAAEDMAARRLKGEDTPKRYEFKGIKKDGVPVYIEASAVDTMYKGSRVILTYLTDVTDRRRALEALHESEAKYRTVVENSLVGFYIVQDNRFRFVNKRLCEILGYPYEEIVDKLDPLETTHPDDRRKVEDNLKRRLAGEVHFIEDAFRVVRKDGKTITVKAIGTVLSFNGRPAAMGSLVDITREETLELQLRQALKMEAIGTLAGGVAHDFNNILTVISGYASLLTMATDKSSPLRSYVDPILSSSEKAANLTRSLLAFSRQQPISLTPLDMNHAIGKTEKLLKRLLTEDVELITSLCPGELIIMADPTQIEQILFNLAANARDAMQRGGRITIETKSAELDQEFIACHGYGEQGRYALLTFSDTGSGMDEATKEKIFDPFFTTKSIGKGTGLGLSTVYGIMKQHNGHISVYSEPHTGTTFHIYFPVVRATARAEKRPTPEIKKGSETILVAEDDEAVRLYMKSILSRYGYHVIEGIDGEDALEKFRMTAKIDLMIIDSVMPKKNGREVFDEARAVNPRIKVIFTSGYTKDVVLDKGIEEGEVDFMSKPILAEEMLMKIREVLDRQIAPSP
jgi:two-component system, cell cycle sensor histidine kinase and response regulator CckA